jgi:membrane fusion protein (multidrug efflux system)
LGTVENRIVATGSLRAAEVVTLAVETLGTLEIMSGSAGRRLAEGDPVRAGDLIAKVTGEDVRLAARREAVQQRLAAVQMDLDAKRKLLERRLITQKDLEDQLSLYEEAKLDLDRALHSEKRNRLITPIDGVILRLGRNTDGQHMANGQLVSAGQIIAQIAQTDRLIADIDLVGQDIERVKLGAEALVNYHAFAKRDFPGTLRRFAPMIDERTRALRAEVEVANAEGLLRPGMFVEVTLIVERRQGVPIVPRRAIAIRGGERVVFVLGGQRALRRVVELGLGDDEVVEIVSGVQAGDRVVISGLATLADQARVRETGL